MNDQENKYTGVKIAIALCMVWIVVTAIAGTNGWYEYRRNETHTSIYLTVLAPAVFFLLLYTFSHAIRDWAKSLNLAMLTLPHAWRTVGYTFLALWFYEVLPAGFAAPAGFGDFAVAIAAPFIAVALWLHWKLAITAALWFHVLGLVDLIVAIMTGTTGFGVAPEHMETIDPMTAFPMVIIPTSFVPLLILSHVMVLIRIATDRK